MNEDHTLIQCLTNALANMMNMVEEQTDFIDVDPSWLEANDALEAGRDSLAIKAKALMAERKGS